MIHTSPAACRGYLARGVFQGERAFAPLESPSRGFPAQAKYYQENKNTPRSSAGIFIKVARFLAYGSTVVIACCEYSCRWVEGKRLHEAQQLDSASMMAALDLTSLQAHTVRMVLRLMQEALHRAAEQVST